MEIFVYPSRLGGEGARDPVALVALAALAEPQEKQQLPIIDNNFIR